jgi:hypothetical protein
VEYHLDPGDSATTHLDVAEIPSEKLDVVRHTREIRLVAGAEIVYHPDGVSERNEPVDEMRADEAGSPRY